MTLIVYLDGAKTGAGPVDKGIEGVKVYVAAVLIVGVLGIVSDDWSVGVTEVGFVGGRVGELTLMPVGKSVGTVLAIST